MADMEFTFPKDKAIHKGTICNYGISGEGVKYREIDISNPISNSINIGGEEYYFKYLNDSPRNKGGNSIILELYSSQSIDVNDVDYEKPDSILKILKFKKSYNPRFKHPAEKRFLKEIDALNCCFVSNSQNIIEIYESGTCKIWSNLSDQFEEYLFYTMEYADYDLKGFIESKHETLSFEEKINLCISLANGIDELRNNGYYHRDIKPDNIFIVGDNWKIGDLGLIADRHHPNSIDRVDEFIGPRGWISPEAMNKYLTGGKRFNYKCDVSIDHQSDIFQLGRVFWYVFQHNAPIGTVKSNDFLIKNSRLFSIIKTMINYSKLSRYNDVLDVIHLLKPIQEELLLDRVY